VLRRRRRRSSGRTSTRSARIPVERSARRGHARLARRGRHRLGAEPRERLRLSDPGLSDPAGRARRTLAARAPPLPVRDPERSGRRLRHRGAADTRGRPRHGTHRRTRPRRDPRGRGQEPRAARGEAALAPRCRDGSAGRRSARPLRRPRVRPADGVGRRAAARPVAPGRPHGGAQPAARHAEREEEAGAAMATSIVPRRSRELTPAPSVPATRRRRPRPRAGSRVPLQGYGGQSCGSAQVHSRGRSFGPTASYRRA
jgi:hypothetical protein